MSWAPAALWLVPPIVCDWCDRPVLDAVSLFANGRGWTSCCRDCLDVIAPIEAAIETYSVRRGGGVPGGARGCSPLLTPARIPPCRGGPRRDGRVTHA